MDDIVSRLEQCIAKNCPIFAQDKLKLWACAQTIITNLEKHEQVVGRFSDGHKVRQIKKHLEKALFALEELSEFSREQVTMRMQRIDDESQVSTFESQLTSLQSLYAGIVSLEKSYISRNPPMHGLRSKGMAVSAACISIWRDAHGEENTPTSPHKDRLGPMSRFVEEVLDILQIGVSAGVAVENALTADFVNLWEVSLTLPKT